MSLRIRRNTSLTITLANLTVTDPDNVYPTDFTISVKSGSNYKVSEATIRPASSFTGTSKVPVTVNGGSADSTEFDLVVTLLHAGEYWASRCH